MATNADTTVVDDDKPVTSEDLRELKYGTDEVETSTEADETSEAEETAENTEEASAEDGQTDDQATEDTDETAETESDSSEYVKEFPNIKGDSLEDYARGLEQAYKNSTTEALRLKGELDKKPATVTETTETEEIDTSDPVTLFMKQKMDEEISEAFSSFQKTYPQAVPGTPEYAQFVTEVGTLSQTILASQKRLASPKELYTKAAVILGWEPDTVDGKDKLGIALKGQAGSSKTTSTIKTPKKSKVTDQMVAANKLMYPLKTDAEIREELEPYVK